MTPYTLRCLNYMNERVLAKVFLRLLLLSPRATLTCVPRGAASLQIFIDGKEGSKQLLEPGLNEIRGFKDPSQCGKARWRTQCLSSRKQSNRVPHKKETFEKRSHDKR